MNVNLYQTNKLFESPNIRTPRYDTDHMGGGKWWESDIVRMRMIDADTCENSHPLLGRRKLGEMILNTGVVRYHPKYILVDKSYDGQ